MPQFGTGTTHLEVDQLIWLMGECQYLTMALSSKSAKTIGNLSISAGKLANSIKNSSEYCP